MSSFRGFTGQPEKRAIMSETYALMGGKTLAFQNVEPFTITSEETFLFAIGAAMAELQDSGRHCGVRDACSHLRRMVFGTPDFADLAVTPEDEEKLLATYCDTLGRDVHLAGGTVRVDNEMNFAIVLGTAFREAQDSGRAVTQFAEVCDDIRRLSARPAPAP